MANRIRGQTSVGGPLTTKVQSGSQRREVESLIGHNNPRVWFNRTDDLDQATLPAPWATKIVGTTPTVAKLANTACGVWRATLAATSEAETAGWDWGDSLMLNDPTAGAVNVNPGGVPNFEAFVRIPTALTTAQTVVIGLATAFNATLTSISKYAWIRLSANMNVLLEGKDGTTTTTGVVPASAPVLVANTFYLVSVELIGGAAIFSLDDAVLGTIPMAALASTDNFMPAVYLQKASGTSVPTLDADLFVTRAYRY